MVDPGALAEGGCGGAVARRRREDREVAQEEGGRGESECGARAERQLCVVWGACDPKTGISLGVKVYTLRVHTHPRGIM